MTGEKRIGVGCVISVAHNSPEGKLHGHSYEIIAWWPFGADARLLQRQLNSAVAWKLDHSLMPADLALAEHLAEHIGIELLPGCVEVEVNRPAERIFAKWMRG